MKIAFSIFGLLAAAGLFLGACLVRIPGKEISSYSAYGDGYAEYVGGDAYNYMIEASLRGGEIAGGKAAQAIYFSASAILFIVSGISLGGTLKENRKKEEAEEEREPEV